MEKYPTIATPNISAVMAAAVANTNQRLKDDDTNHLQSFEPADVVSVSMSPSDQSEYAEDNNGSTVSNFLYNTMVPKNDNFHNSYFSLLYFWL